MPKCFSDFNNTIAEVINDREIKKAQTRKERYIFT